MNIVSLIFISLEFDKKITALFVLKIFVMFFPSNQCIRFKKTINTLQFEQVGKIRIHHNFFLGKSQQVNHQSPLFTPVNGTAVTSQAGQDNLLNPAQKNGFEAKATGSSQKPINPYRKAVKGTETHTQDNNTVLNTEL